MQIQKHFEYHELLHMRESARSFPWTHEWINFFINSNNDDIIFGNGHQASIVESYCRFLSKNLRAGLVSQFPQTNAGDVLRLQVQGSAFRGLSGPVFSLAEVERISNSASCDLVIAVHERHNTAILNAVRRLPFANIFLGPDWIVDNADIRNFWFEWFLTEKGCRFYMTSNGERVVRHDASGLSFYCPKDNDGLKETLAGELHDCVFPSLFADARFCDEGPYEHEPCRFSPGDMFFDLGANISIFSSVASVRGCSVHAFEASLQELNILVKILELYPNINIHRKAVFSHTGLLEFHIN